jgi:HAE1 family hydrophobic/amphiphilic exporter-1
MATYGVVKRFSRLQEQNVEAAQENWRKCRRCFEYVIKYKGRLSEIKDYENIL